MRRLDIAPTADANTAIIERPRPAIVHTNTSVVLSGAIAARRRGVHHVWHLHEVLRDHTELRAVLPLDDVYRIVDALSDRVVTVSDAQRSECGMIDPRKLRTIRNGVPRPAPARDARSAIRRELSIDDDTVLAVAVGALIPRKGHDVLIDAARVARRNGADLHYAIVGRGDDEWTRSLRARAQDIGVDDVFSFLGYRRDIDAILASADLLVHPSRNEALPTSILEAMASGLPVVASDAGGTAELVEHLRSGFVAPVGDAEALAGALTKLGSDIGLRREMGARGRVLFESSFSIDAMTDAFEELYERMLANPAPDPSIAPAVARLIHRYERTYMQRRAIARAGDMVARMTGARRA
jgi:glycosyltransferase involved in cell wall biosynthesis